MLQGTRDRLLQCADNLGILFTDMGSSWAAELAGSGLPASALQLVSALNRLNDAAAVDKVGDVD